MRFTRFLIAVLILQSLTGCAVINSIFGKSSDEPVPVPHGNGDGYSGMAPRSFYWMHPTYKCTNGNGENISSYRDRIDVYADGTFVQKGDQCSTSDQTKGDSAELEISNNLLGYRDGIYQEQK